jgi:hypothetical protein
MRLMHLEEPCYPRAQFVAVLKLRSASVIPISSAAIFRVPVAGIGYIATRADLTAQPSVIANQPATLTVTGQRKTATRDRAILPHI